VSRVVVLNHVALDGVMQSPGRSGEDTRDGFRHGGWSPRYGDDVMGQAMGARMLQSGGLLFGRRTYVDLLTYWNSQTGSPFTDALNNTPKYVATATLREPLPWPSSTGLAGNVAEAVAKLKGKAGKDLYVMGSGALIQSLMPRSLIDEYVLMIHPLVLGSGRRLFPGGSPPTCLRLAGTKPTTGVVIAACRPAGPAGTSGG
jgi:dihydrofolate reductase